MSAVFINNLCPRMKIDKSDVLKVVRKTLSKCKQEKNCELSITFVDDAYMINLNRKYLKRNYPTDVISFPMQEGFRIPGKPEYPILLGDVFISLPAVKRQAKRYQHSLKREVKILVIHGVLHLLGCDHRKKIDKVKMETKEREILQSLKNKKC